MLHRHQPFSLLCFPHGPGCPQLEIKGEISLQAHTLTLDYRLTGDLAGLDLPPANHPPQRRDELWRHSCFELFIAASGQPGYHEFNLSPSGNWNCYRFSGYRQGMQSETALAALPFTITNTADQLELQLSLDLSQLYPASDSLDIGITAVVQQNDRLSYWALAHPGKQPDFHHRHSFVLTVGEEE